MIAIIIITMYLAPCNAHHWSIKYQHAAALLKLPPFRFLRFHDCSDIPNDSSKPPRYIFPLLYFFIMSISFIFHSLSHLFLLYLQLCIMATLA